VVTEYERIRNELRLAGAKTIVISSNLALNGDNSAPYARQGVAPNGDPGVAVYWTRQEKRGGRWMHVPYCIPCDKYNSIADNLHAIALSINAMRGMERWGAVTVEQAFAGFAALPPGSGQEIVPQQPHSDWRTVLSCGRAWPEGLEPSELLAVAKARHRILIAEAHPDVGGSDARASELNAAMETAEQELKNRE
jgi:hypothetical protein